MGGQGERQAKLPLFTWPRKMCSVELHTFPFCQSTNKYFSQTILNPGGFAFLVIFNKKVLREGSYYSRPWFTNYITRCIYWHCIYAQRQN